MDFTADYGLKTRQVASCLWLRRGVLDAKILSHCQVLFIFYSVPSQVKRGLSTINCVIILI